MGADGQMQTLPTMQPPTCHATLALRSFPSQHPHHGRSKRGTRPSWNRTSSRRLGRLARVDQHSRMCTPGLRPVIVAPWQLGASFPSAQLRQLLHSPPTSLCVSTGSAPSRSETQGDGAISPPDPGAEPLMRANEAYWASYGVPSAEEGTVRLSDGGRLIASLSSPGWVEKDSAKISSDAIFLGYGVEYLGIAGDTSRDCDSLRLPLFPTYFDPPLL